MTKPEWGTKRICPNCGTRYYDMRRDPITCPKCGAPFDAESLVKSRKSRAVAPAAVEDVAPLEEELEADLAAEPDEAGEVATEIPVGEEAEGETEEEPEAATVGKGKGRGKGADGEEKKGGEDEDEEVLEDASELGEDEDDMAEVIENVDEEDDR